MVLQHHLYDFEVLYDFDAAYDSNATKYRRRTKGFGILARFMVIGQYTYAASDTTVIIVIMRQGH
jgi:hypothetical protein